jgi:serine/threonine-protein kinase RsbW
VLAVPTESDLKLGLPHLQATGPQACSLDLPSCIEILEAVDVFVGGMAKSAGFDHASTQDVQIAVHEAVINAVVHGNGQDVSRRVRLAVAVGPTGLEARVQDQGRGFDPGVVPDPLAAQNLCRPCGRGLLFMRSLMDEVGFRRTADGGMEVRLLKRRVPTSRGGQ